ncbi:transmembrane protein [Plakobranchus ocellatus]|uniref:Transmembrane protein n=1 Tax=Plakobranchus ocellatus TaxID=259542 RepID=A0AAV4C8V5_9GAST|nr:transmembrane protein [Plakobranchus ocellatus]
MARQALNTVASLAKDYVSYFKAIFARTLFGTHALVAVWRTTVLMGVAYWALSFGVVCLCVEYIVTMWVNMGEEWPCEPKVAQDKTFCYILLVIWTGSLFQFFLVLTATKKAEEEKISWKSIICSSEVWQILVQVGLQDLPFLIVRIIVMLLYQVFNYTIIFFVCKNSLVISLEINHMYGLCKEQKARLQRRQARISGLKKKLNAAKNSILLAKKTPFVLSAKKPEKHLGTGQKGNDNIFSVVGSTLSAKRSEAKPDAQPISQDPLQVIATNEKCPRSGSHASKASSDSYETAVDGLSTRSTSVASSHNSKDIFSTNFARASAHINSKTEKPAAKAVKTTAVVDNIFDKITQASPKTLEEIRNRGTPPLKHYLNTSSATSFNATKGLAPGNSGFATRGAGEQHSPTDNSGNIPTLFQRMDKNDVF